MKARTKRGSQRVGRVTEGRGNVFADLRLPNPEQELLKAQLALQIYTILKASGMKQVEIAKVLGVQQPQVSLLMRNRAGYFSVERLVEFLTALQRDVRLLRGLLGRNMGYCWLSPPRRKCFGDGV